MRAASVLALVATLARCSRASPPAPIGLNDAAVPAMNADAAPAVVAEQPDAASAPAPSEPVPAEPVGQAMPALRKDAPARRYAGLGAAACLAQLVSRKIPFVRAEATYGVRTPIRLAGPLHGVTVHSEVVEKKRAKSKFEIFDCRLVLALDDFTELVARHDVVEILHMSAYRSWKERGCTSKVGNKQHCGGLAVDVGSFVKKDGRRLVVEREFNGKIGQGTCVTNTKPVPSTPEAEELWSYVCDAARRTLFNVVLTPNFNAEHKSHFHLEITPGVDWMLVH